MLYIIDKQRQGPSDDLNRYTAAPFNNIFRVSKTIEIASKAKGFFLHTEQLHYVFQATIVHTG